MGSGLKIICSVIVVFMLIMSAHADKRLSENDRHDFEEDLAVPHVTEANYIYGNRLVAEIVEGEVSFYHSDHLGNVRQKTDMDGQSVSRMSYYPYGDDYDGQGNNTFRFTGMEKDATGLLYFGARFYDADLGRFLGVDPFSRFVRSSYEYALGNPLKNVDPDGREPESVHDVIYDHPYKGSRTRSSLGNPFLPLTELMKYMHEKHVVLPFENAKAGDRFARSQIEFWGKKGIVLPRQEGMFYFAPGFEGTLLLPVTPSKEQVIDVLLKSSTLDDYAEILDNVIVRHTEADGRLVTTFNGKPLSPEEELELSIYRATLLPKDIETHDLPVQAKSSAKPDATRVLLKVPENDDDHKG